MVRKRVTTVSVLALVLIMGVVGSVAAKTETWTGDGVSITFSTPDNYSACEAQTEPDTITAMGLPAGWHLNGWVNVQYVTDSGRQDVPGGYYPVNWTSNGINDFSLQINYPPLADWPTFPVPYYPYVLAEIHVDLSITVTDGDGNLITWVGGDQANAPGKLGPGGFDWDLWCSNPPPPGTDGCTPGYWKQPQHVDSWVGYATTDSFDTVFGVDATGDLTLLEALNANGGGENALMRHATAALLNAASAGVNYPHTVAEVIAEVQTAYASGNFELSKDFFEAKNEAFCPLD